MVCALSIHNETAEILEGRSVTSVGSAALDELAKEAGRDDVKCKLEGLRKQTSKA
jgi:hypothetical protein